MTVAEFLDELRRTSRVWRLECVGLAFPGVIRAPECPVIAVCQRRFGPDHPLPARDENVTRVIAAGRELGLADADTCALVAAADAYHDHDPALRRSLLEATNL